MSAPWAQRVPVLRTYEALRTANARVEQAKAEVRALRADRDLARSLSGHVISRARLKDILRTCAEAYRTADPFPHIVLDDLFDARLLQAVLREFDALDRRTWHYTERETERKYSTEDFETFGPVTRGVFSQLNASPFVTFLEKLTGLSGLIADPHLRGGGLHEIRRGGALGVHADFNYYKRLNLYRRLNLLVYLNEDWCEDWGGALELWDRTGTACVRAIAPLFNRAVIFDTSNFSYHGHPHALQCPPERARKSLALYYYTATPPAGIPEEPHSTVFIQGGPR